MIALLLCAATVEAATRTSTAAGGTWTTTTTWVGGVVPGTTDLVVIATTGTGVVNMTGNTTCAGITVNIGSKITLNNRTLTVNGSVVNNGTMTWTTGRFTQSGNGDFTNNGTVSLASGTNVMTFRGSLYNNGTIAFANRPITFTGTNTAASSVDGFTTTGLVTYSRSAGSTTFTGDVQAAGLTVSAGTLNLGTDRNHTISGAITISGGTLNGGTNTTLHANLVGTAWSRTGTFTANTGTVDFGGAGNQSIAGSATIFNNLTFSNTGNKTWTNTPTVNAILSLEGSATTTSAPTFGTSATIQYKAITTSRTNGNEFPSTFAGTGGLIMDPGNGITITLNGTKTGFKGNLQVLSGIFDLASFSLDHVLPAGGILSLAANTTLKIGGTTLPSNYSTHSIDASSTVEYDGTDQTVAALNSSQGYGNLILSGSGTKTLAASTIPIYGNFENNGATTSATGNTLNLCGTSEQLVGGTSASTFDNVILSNTAGATLNTNQTVNGILSLTNGLLNTGSNTLIMGCSGSIANASATRYVNGKLAWTFCSAGSKTFPIGTGGNYRPLTLNFTTLTGTSTVTAEQLESNLPGTIPSDVALFSDRYWQLSETGGSSYSFNLTLDGTGWSPTSYLKILKGDGSTNTYHTATTPYYTNTSAFTSFGNFGLGQLNWVTWIGNTNNWHSATNWTSETIPLNTDDIRIPSSVSFQPTISGSSPANDFSIAGIGKLQIQSGANLTLENGPLLTFQSGATVTTGSGSKIVLKSDARYLNLSTSSPTLEVQRELTGSKGWRMLSAPVASTYSDLFKSPMVTQGFTGSSFPTLQPNLLWWLESDGGTSLQSWRQPNNQSDALVAGRGYFQYTFNGAGRLNLDGSPSGSNYPDVLPQTISSTGVDNFNGSGSYNFNLTYTPKSTTQTPSPTDTIYYDLNALDEGWNLLGNPTASTLDWDAASGWTKTNVDNTIYIWDPSALSGNGDYLTWNGSTGTLGNGRIAPYQAFWVHANASPALSLDNDAKTSTIGTFLRNTSAEEPISLSIHLTVGDLKTTSIVSFSDLGRTGPDRWDAYRMESMSENRLDLFTLSSPEFVSPLVINHLPEIRNELVSIPLYYEVHLPDVATDKNVALSWSLPSNWPSDWNISLLDHRTQEAVSMKERSQYLFMAEIKKDVVPQIGKLPLPKTLLKPLTSNSMLRSSSTEQPFSIVVYKGSDIAYLPSKPHLVGSTTNPFRIDTNIRFSLPEKARTSIEVYSAQGKKITILADEVFPAGITEIPWNASNLAPDLYLIRLVSGSTVDIKKAVLIQ